MQSFLSSLATKLSAEAARGLRQLDEARRLRSHPMKEGTFANFGLLIAYIVPGFAAVWAGSYYSPVVAAWLQGSAAELPTVGGFLFVTIASIAAGIIVSTIRWLLVDALHHATGIPPTEWDFSRLQANVDAYRILVDIHYRYYQFYANTFVAAVFLYVAHRTSLGDHGLGLLDVGFVLVEVILFLGSRDTLRKYYARGTQMLAPANQAVQQPPTRRVSRREAHVLAVLNKPLPSGLELPPTPEDFLAPLRDRESADALVAVP